jgi:lipopolysaccharide transport system permease protein
MSADFLLAVTTYLAAFWLRFEGRDAAKFLPGFLFAAPLVVVTQMLVLAVSGAYARRVRDGWVLPIAAAVLGGTAIAGAGVGFSSGFEGVSRGTFIVHALLLTAGVIGWRAAWLLYVRPLAVAFNVNGEEMIDRSQEMTTVRAIVLGLYRYRELLKNLVVKDLKLKYRGSALGFVWSLINPLMMIVVYTLAFSYILRIRGTGFVFYLMLGQLAWTFFATSSAMATGAIVDNAGLLKSVTFPRAILPIGTVLFNLAQYLLTIGVFLPVMLFWYRVPLSGPMVLFPVFLMLQVLFTIGVALILATATAFFRDVRHLIEVLLAVMFWTTPILYEIRQVPDRLRLPILLSPMSSFVVAYERMFFYREWPDPTIWAIACAYSLGALAIGMMMILAFDNRFSEQL